MILGPLLVVGSLAFLFFYLGGTVPTDVSPGWLLVLALVVAWLLSLKVLPEKRCYICKGDGDLGWGLLRRVCPRCLGSGRIRRVGSKRG